jgi:hypothetical protein
MLVRFRDSCPLPISQSIISIGDIKKLIKFEDIIKRALLPPGLLGSGLYSFFKSSVEMSHVLQFIKFDVKLSSSSKQKDTTQRAVSIQISIQIT